MSANFDIANFTERVFKISSPEDFNDLALELFQYQCSHNSIYEAYISNLEINSAGLTRLYDIPFLPIGFFKSQKVITGKFDEEMVFSSSGTTGLEPSKHYVRDLALYRRSFLEGFRIFYGHPASYHIFGLLPSYLEREGSSLVYMVDALIREGGHSGSGFFLNEHAELARRLEHCRHERLPAILIGVSFALLDFSEQYPLPLGEDVILMETGGMKGRREEITRDELHQALCKRFHIDCIHSEYGMTELLSQSYSKGGGIFNPPPWMKVLIRDIQDPFTFLEPGITGAINIIDLANVHSCAFIETQDIGRLRKDGSFEVLGRTDISDIRGCSLLVG